MSQEANKVVHDDAFFAAESNYSFSYHFVDKNGKLIPNEFGYRVIKLLKNCVQQGRAFIPHSDVNPILAQHTREDLAQMLEDNGMAWTPYVPPKGKAIKAADNDASEFPSP